MCGVSLCVLAPKTTFFALGIAEFLEDFFLALGEVLRSFDDDSDDMWAAVAIGAHQRYAMTGKLERGARLSASGDFHTNVAIDGFHIDLGAESGINHGNSALGKDDVAFAGEMFVGFNSDENIEVAALTALRGSATLIINTDRHTVVDTGGNFNLKVLTIGGDDFSSTKNGFLESEDYGSTVVGTTGWAALATKAKN